LRFIFQHGGGLFLGSQPVRCVGHNTIAMRIYKLGCTLLLLSMFNLSFAQQQIEGLLYTDGKPVSVKINDGVILEVKRIPKLSDKSKIVFIAPGLIDNQVNGFNGVSFSPDDTASALNAEGISIATKALWQKGVTTFLPTLTTSSQGSLIRNFAVMAKAKNDEALLGSIAGFHLEGPYISPVAGYRGAHPEKFVRNPVWEEFLELYKASGNGIVTVTLAPEIDGAMEFIRKLTDLGIVVALGHHNASTAVVDQAVDNGARICTHMGNGLANTINRHNNPLWPQLSNDKLMISIICDGFHLKPEEIRVFYRIKGPEKTILTSDVTRYAGMSPGIYKNEMGEDIELTNDGELRYPAQNVLYGSASPLNLGIGHMMQVTGCSLAEAVQMASLNPARLYGLNDRGSIAPGKRADMIVFTMENNTMKILRTYVKGKMVFDAGE
jgi:N-acetylglucosamine-6-phosphate deacetylase